MFLVSEYFWKYNSSYLVSVAESKNLRCHPCESRGPERKNWIPASAGMTNTVSATGTIYAIVRKAPVFIVAFLFNNVVYIWNLMLMFRHRS